MKFKNQYLIGITIGFIILIIDLYAFRDTKWLIPLVVVAITISWFQIWIDFFIQNQKKRDIENRFLDFVRNLSGAIKSGMPVSRAIVHISTIDYGSLSPYVRKLGHQVEWAIPVHKALLLFGNATRSDVIKRSISTVIEAEQSGGNMEDVLTSIVTSLIEIRKIKEERRASIHSQVIQSYIIFLIFMGVMVIIQNMLAPYLIGQQESGMFDSRQQNNYVNLGFGGGGASIPWTVDIEYTSFARFILTVSQWFTSLRGVFVMLTMIQGFFAGVIIGKLSEGDVTAGLKHSIILMTMALFVMSLFKPAIG